MSHAHHFLSRLDRVSYDQMELALSLYNDPGAVKFILSNARLPDGAERVGISLAHPEVGPFLVLTREGRFVTCLAKGMRCDNHPVITRERFDALHARASDHKARHEMQMRLAPDQRSSSRLLARIFTAADGLTREEFVAIGAMQPMLWGTLYDWTAETNAWLIATEKMLHGQTLMRARHLQLMRVYREQLWALRHLYLLLGIDAPRERLERLRDAFLATVRTPLSGDAPEHGLMIAPLAAAWYVGRCEDAYLPLLKHRWERETRQISLFQQSLDMLAIAARRPDLRREIRDTICLTGHDDPAVRELDYARTFVRKRFDDQFDLDHDLDLAATRYGASLLVEHYRHPVARQAGWASPYDVPLDVARPFLLNLRWNYFRHTHVEDEMVALMGSIARLDAEDFYYPAKWVGRFHEPWTDAEVWEHLRVWDRYFAPQPPLRVPAAPGRNAACPCGSGLKYKKCCDIIDRAANNQHGSFRADIERTCPTLLDVLRCNRAA